MPVVSKTRAAARNTSCASSLRQMGVGWMAYLSDNDGRLPDYTFQMQPGNSAWYEYWPGILAKAGVMGQVLLCPGASEEAPADRSAGFGSVQYAWTGKYSPVVNGSGVRLNDEAYRVSSYGHNRYLTRNGFKRDGSANCLSAIKNPQNVPLFFDCAYADARPVNRGEKLPEPSPPDLRGDGLNETSPQHWRFLLARHGRGINVCFEDGSVRWVRLEESYMLMWNGSWTPYRLQLPMN
jgi:prepilin-type processing-associated H-X9-DG protein